MHTKEYLQAKIHLIEERLDSFVPMSDTPYSLLYKAARYSLLGGGKRLRPVLTLATAEALGANEEQALSAACALEMVHVYSLIHDDLPCMDDDDFRRGKPSLHKAFNEGHAVLTGDYLLTRAFEVVANDPHLSADKKVRLIQQIASGAGCNGMIAGQVMDLDAEGKCIDLQMLQTIHHYKTGALIESSILCGAIVGEATVKEFDALRAFGRDLGLAFQIIDDVLDVTSGSAKRGSVNASDEVNGKTTYVTLLGVEPSQKRAEELFDRALSHLAGTRLENSRLNEIAVSLVKRDK